MTFFVYWTSYATSDTESIKIGSPTFRSLLLDYKEPHLCLSNEVKLPTVIVLQLDTIIDRELVRSTLQGDEHVLFWTWDYDGKEIVWMLLSESANHNNNEHWSRKCGMLYTVC